MSTSLELHVAGQTPHALGLDADQPHSRAARHRIRLCPSSSSRRSTARVRRCVASALTVALAIGVTACGSSSNSTQSAAQGTSASASPSASNSHLTRVTLALGFQWQAQFIPLLYGINQGYFRAQGIDLHIIPASGPLQALQLVSAGKVAFSLPDFDSQIIATTKGEANSKMVYVYEPQPGSGFASLKPLTTPQSMAGQTYATTSTSNTDLVIKNLMKAHGVDPNSLKVRKVDLSVLYPSLFQKSIDAAEADIPGSWAILQSEAAKQHVKIYHTNLSAWGLIGYNHVLTASNKILQTNPALVRRFVAAVAKSQSAARALTGSQVAKLLATQTEVADPAATGTDWNEFKQVTVGAGKANPKIVTKEIGYLRSTGQISTAPSLSSVYTNAFIPPS